MDFKLDHAEKLVENLTEFMEVIMRNRDKAYPLEYALLDGLYSILRDMRGEAVDYRNALKGDVVTDNPIWTAHLRESVLLLDAIFDNLNDTSMVFFPYYITIHSGVKALDW
ncbi:hypothetical protein [Neobacillus sp. OS1-33]|uniref:hypothetical protein n=1 Tax=Neobacillus sp. OS1-33 TaxID=3070683 RepID=UPI0027DEDC1B|nr:hypothetical protein [Neobacillus sp. OS1-33]WML25664.1 hypothetical protein RCG22_23040 [Neobacillus sp. OS1-33]